MNNDPLAEKLWKLTWQTMLELLQDQPAPFVVGEPPRCRRCRHPLHLQESVTAGIGPVCARREDACDD